MRTYIYLTLLLTLLMAVFGVWYLRSPLATNPQVVPFPEPADSLSKQTPGGDTSPVPVVTGESNEPEDAPAKVVLDLSLPDDIGRDHVLPESAEDRRVLPDLFETDPANKYRSIKGRIMLDETDEGATVVDGVEINIERPLR